MDELPTAQRLDCRYSGAARCQGGDMGQPPSSGTLLHEVSPWEGGLWGKTNPVGLR